MNTDRHGCTDCRAVRDERDRLKEELDAARSAIAEVAKAVGADHEDHGEVTAKVRKTQAGLEKARQAETKTRRCNIELRADVESYRRRFLHLARLLGVDVASLLGVDSDDPREDVLAARVMSLQQGKEAMSAWARGVNRELEEVRAQLADVERERDEARKQLERERDDAVADRELYRNRLRLLEHGTDGTERDRPMASLELSAAREEARALDTQLKVAQARVVGLHAENLQLRRMMGVE